jgi:hypothetical protein
MISQKNLINLTVEDIPATGEIKKDFPSMLQDIAASFSGTLSFGYLKGQVGSSPPTSNIGPWLNGNAWWGWSTAASRYLPMPLGTGHLGSDGKTVYYHTLNTTSRDQNIVLYLPQLANFRVNDVLATVADLSQVPHRINATITLPQSATHNFNIDFSAKTRFILFPLSNFSISGTGGTDGSMADLWIYIPRNTGVAFVITWPATGWNPEPGLVLPTTTSLQTKIVHIQLKQISTFVFAELLDTFTFSSGGQNQPLSNQPSVQLINTISNTGVIDIELDRVMAGSEIPVSEFIVERNGQINRVTYARTSGMHLYVTVQNAFVLSDSAATIQFLSGSVPVTDIDGNTLAIFGPSPIQIDSAGILTNWPVAQGLTGRSSTVGTIPTVSPPQPPSS